MNEERIRELLREMRDDPMPADSLARVRQRVGERTQQARRRIWGPWNFAALAIALVCVILIVWPRRPVSVPRPTQPAGVSPQTAVAEAPPIAPEPAVRPVRRKKTGPKAAESITIRIETPDPDVVILLVGEGD